MPSTARASAANAGISRPALDQRVEHALLALEVLALQPGALAPVGVDEHGVAARRGPPTPAGRREQDGVVESSARRRRRATRASHSTRAPRV